MKKITILALLALTCASSIYAGQSKVIKFAMLARVGWKDNGLKGSFNMLKPYAIKHLLKFNPMVERWQMRNAYVDEKKVILQQMKSLKTNSLGVQNRSKYLERIQSEYKNISGQNIEDVITRNKKYRKIALGLAVATPGYFYLKNKKK